MSYEAVLEQIKHKKGKRQKFEKHNAPKERDFGKAKNSAEDVEGKVEESSQSMGLTTADNASVKSLKNLDLNSSNR